MLRNEKYLDVVLTAGGSGVFKQILFIFLQHEHQHYG